MWTNNVHTSSKKTLRYSVEDISILYSEAFWPAGFVLRLVNSMLDFLTILVQDHEEFVFSVTLKLSCRKTSNECY